MPKAWMKDRKRDYYYQKAKREQYRSRAAYKLLEANTKYHFIKHSDIVVDLGAAPGGWIQVVKKIVGNRGFVLGIDLEPISPFPQEYVRTIIGDVNQPKIIQEILDFLPKEADVLVSDAAPNISGIWDVDQARQIALAEQALLIAEAVLRDSGNFFVKVFEGDLLNDFLKKIRENFGTVRVTKPKASRPKSSELFMLGMNYQSP